LGKRKNKKKNGVQEQPGHPIIVGSLTNDNFLERNKWSFLVLTLTAKEKGNNTIKEKRVKREDRREMSFHFPS
jgi:hypothetical protein